MHKQPSRGSETSQQTTIGIRTNSGKGIGEYAALAAGFHRPADLRYDPELAPIRSELSIAEL